MMSSNLTASIALITSPLYPHLADDDQILLQHLKPSTLYTEVVCWDDPSVEWNGYDMLIIRSCWDSHLREKEFKEWLFRMAASSPPLWNPVQVLRWNYEKTYLRDLERRGVPIVPTVWLDQGTAPSLAEIMDKQGWQGCVFKPVISASGNNTHLVMREHSDDLEELFQFSVSREPHLVQEFVESIKTEGEMSFVFFGKEFSHGLRKIPREGEFRVQMEHGGAVLPFAPDKELITQAERIIQSVEEPLLYGRVDGILRNDVLHIMELELLEPELFFRIDPESPGRFLNQMMKLLSQ